MDKITKDNLLTALIIVAGIAIVLVPYSLLIGWNVLTLILFWAIIVPAIAINAPKLLPHIQPTTFGKLLGLFLFYAGMVFMIYEHYQTDFFLVMMLGAVENVIMVLLYDYAQKAGETQQVVG